MFIFLNYDYQCFHFQFILGIKYFIILITRKIQMIDQESQIPTIYKNIYKNYTIVLSMKESTLTVQVQNNQTYQKYHQLITYEYISSEKQFNNVFDQPQDLFEYLMINIKDVFVQNNNLKFRYKYGGGLKKKEKIIQILMIKQNIDRLELAHIKIDKLKEQFLQKDQKMILLEKKYEQLQSAFNQFREEMKAKQKIKIDLENKIKSSKNQIGPHPKNANQQLNKIIKISENSSKITISTGGWYNFTNKFQIQPSLTENIRYSVKIVRQPNHFVMIGFCTEIGVGKQNNFSSPQSIYYYCNDGTIRQGGPARQINVQSCQGETIDCVADFPNSKIMWFKANSKFGEAPIPPAMINKPIYFSVCVGNTGEIDLFI